MAKKASKSRMYGPLAKTMALQKKYLAAMGLFQSSWAAIEVNTDFAIGRMLGVTYYQTHLITSGVMFGRRSRLFVDLLKNSDCPNKPKILEAFNTIRGSSLRDVFAHAYIASGGDTVTFIERPGGHEFRVKHHEFTMDNFIAHVNKIVKAGVNLHNELKIQQSELDAFAHAAFNPSRSDTKSPGKPIS